MWADRVPVEVVVSDSIGSKLRALRVAAGLSQTALGRSLDRSQASIAAYESGEVAIGLRELVRALRALGVPLSAWGEILALVDTQPSDLMVACA